MKIPVALESTRACTKNSVHDFKRDGKVQRGSVGIKDIDSGV